MAKVMVTESYLEAVGDALREKLGVQQSFMPSQMAEAILSISVNTSENREKEILDRTLLGAYSNATLKRIGAYGLTECSRLTEIKLNQCSSIGKGALARCSRLITASFPVCESRMHTLRIFAALARNTPTSAKPTRL